MGIRRHSTRLEWLRKRLYQHYLHAPTPELRKDYYAMYKLCQDAEDEISDMVMDAQSFGIRNPAYDGDWVGWLDDDFDPDDEYGWGKGKKK